MGSELYTTNNNLTAMQSVLAAAIELELLVY